MERILLAIIGLFLAAQTTQAREPLSQEEVAQIIQEFQYEAQYNEVSTYKDGGFFDSCWVYYREFETLYPGATEPLRVSLSMYIPNRDSLGKDAIPAVIMIPPIGGENLLDRRTAGTLCDRNMAGIILTNDFANIDKQAKGDLLPPEDHHETFYRIAAAIKGVITMMGQDENLDSQRIGLFGVSLGGILGSFVMATQPDIAAGYFVVAGGDIPQILATSEQEEVSTIRRKRMREQGFETREEYEAYLRQYVVFDPIDLAKTMMPETLNMVISNRDEAVPTSNQYLLHEAFGEPEASFYNDSHVFTILSFLFPSGGRRKVARFFEKRFAQENPRPAAFRWLNSYFPMTLAGY